MNWEMRCKTQTTFLRGEKNKRLFTNFEIFKSPVKSYNQCFKCNKWWYINYSLTTPYNTIKSELTFIWWHIVCNTSTHGLKEVGHKF